MSDLIFIIFSAAIINNIIVLEMMGADPALAFLRKLDVAFGLSATMCILLPLITVSCYLLETQLIIPLQLEYLRLLFFVSIIILVIWCLKLWGQHNNSKFTGLFNVFLPFAGINTTILGTVILSQKLVNGFFQSLAFSIGTVLGFSLILLMLTAINERLEVGDVPRSIQGIPALLITLAMISMAFSGFTGLFAG
jgi:Na+-translocating ferredoxin:NAD+ oxidoreductase subunit A